MRFKPGTSRKEVQRFRKRGGCNSLPAAEPMWLHTKQFMGYEFKLATNQMPRVPKTISPGTWPYVTNMKFNVLEGVLFAYGYFPQDTGYTLLFLGKW
jgi:hypothetical protein